MAFHNNPKIVRDKSLLVCLDASDTKSYSGSGSTWTDLSGNGNNATLYNSPTYTQPLAGKSVGITIDGVDQYIKNTSLTGGDTDFSIEIWVYHNGTDQNASYGIYSGGNNYGPLIYHHGTGMGTGHYFPGSTGGDYPGGNSASTVNGKWTQIVHTYFRTKTDSTVGVYKSYKNGAHVGSTSSFNFNNSGHGRGSNGYTLGSYYDAVNMYKGSYGSFKYYNRVITAAEVYQNFDAHKSRFGLS